jgi:NADPH:quinone reductase-like Zn-dependent oxidoreductase
MTTMNAAVVTSFDEPPRHQPFPVPEPADGEVLADVIAAGLHPRVRTGAAGAHYTSSGTLPMIPGIGDDVLGTMADKALVRPAHPGRCRRGGPTDHGRRRDMRGTGRRSRRDRHRP